MNKMRFILPIVALFVLGSLIVFAQAAQAPAAGQAAPAAGARGQAPAPAAGQAAPAAGQRGQAAPPAPVIAREGPAGARPPMSFFVTSAGLNKGGNLGGIQGADRHCQDLAAAAGAGNRTWRAYLSVTNLNGKGAVNARDRIGTGPWYNAKGVRIARNVEDLHSDSNNVFKETALNEKGETIPTRPNVHDIITGSTIDGRAWDYDLLDLLNIEAGAMTCNNYTSDAEAGFVMLGHMDRGGTSPISPWNAAHPSVGCSQEKIASTGSGGLFYCFAIDAN